jgi:hypothetical protein
MNDSMADKKTELAAISEQKTLQDLDVLLKALMTQQRIQAAIKGDDLDRVVSVIVRLSDTGESGDQLRAAAMLGRLAAVARGRESLVLGRVSDAVTRQPPPIDTLADEKEKGYAALAVSSLGAAWVEEYCAVEVFGIDAADSARRELLGGLLSRCGTASQWFGLLMGHAARLRDIENPESRLRKVRRIVCQMAVVLTDYQGEVGRLPGSSLGDLATRFIGSSSGDMPREVSTEIFECFLVILTRLIELRFSIALETDTYSILEKLKKLAGALDWGAFLSVSTSIHKVRTALLESALVLARQSRTDKRLLDLMLCAYTSRPQIAGALKRHFSTAQDLDPDVANWWATGGVASESGRQAEHSIGNTEDQQIGALLIEVEANRGAMERLQRAAVPFLEIYDPVLASTVSGAVSGYLGTAQIARRLARMRKLAKTDLKGARIEYNPLEHEMIGGHRQGVRMVKVVRDGVQKDFNGRVKTLVKPWVEPLE